MDISWMIQLDGLWAMNEFRTLIPGETPDVIGAAAVALNDGLSIAHKANYSLRFSSLIWSRFGSG
jgi:hypothetical protein